MVMLVLIFIFLCLCLSRDGTSRGSLVKRSGSLAVGLSSGKNLIYQDLVTWTLGWKKDQLTLSLVETTSVDDTVVGIEVDVLVVLVPAQAPRIGGLATLGGGERLLNTLDGALGEVILDL